MNRRRFLGATAGGIVAGTVSWPAAAVARSPGPGPATPEEALRALVAGNQRFAANRPTSIAENLEILKAKTADKQHPFGNVDRAIAANAQFQAELLRTSSTMIRDALEQRKIDVRSAAYELASGKVMML
jgi:carbonic anhydrase